jgi:adenine phosphoribosyltransferase
MIDIQNIRIVPDFPTEGIQFYDITTLLNDGEVFQEVFRLLLEKAKQWRIDVIVALEARGYFFAPAMALAMNLPFVPIRKKGKLPFQTYSSSYQLEYGHANIEVHTDALKPNSSILLFDDVLATGGTAAAAVELMNYFHPKKITSLFLLELEALQGRKKLPSQVDVVSLWKV